MSYLLQIVNLNQFQFSIGHLNLYGLQKITSNEKPFFRCYNIALYF